MTSCDFLTPERVYRLLDAESLAYRVIHHKPLMTVADAQSVREPGESGAGHIKNLFLRDKKGNLWLLTLGEERAIDLKQAAHYLGARRLSFCSAERLYRHLGVMPGAVSPFALLNDRDRAVRFFVDEALLGHDLIHAHPLDNRATVTLARADLLDLLARHGHPYRELPLDLAPPGA